MVKPQFVPVATLFDLEAYVAEGLSLQEVVQRVRDTHAHAMTRREKHGPSTFRAYYIEIDDTPEGEQPLRWPRAAEENKANGTAA